MSEPTEYETRAASPAGRLSLAAADLALKTQDLLNSLKERTGFSNRRLALELDVTDSRISQILNGDGNVRIATLARVAHACGFEIEYLARPIGTSKTAGATSRRPSQRSLPSAPAKNHWVTVKGNTTVKHRVAINAVIKKTRPGSIADIVYVTRDEGASHVIFVPNANAETWADLTADAAASEDPRSRVDR